MYTNLVDKLTALENIVNNLMQEEGENMFAWVCEKCQKGHVLSARQTSDSLYVDGRAMCPRCSEHTLTLVGRVILATKAGESTYIDVDPDLADSMGLASPSADALAVAT